MTPDERQAQVDALFLRALEVPAAERATFLDGQCAQLAPDIRPEVDKLIGAHEAAEASSALQMPQALPALDRLPPRPDPLIGRQVGDYVLRKRIGRGGFGTVYLAQRSRDLIVADGRSYERVGRHAQRKRSRHASVSLIDRDH